MLSIEGSADISGWLANPRNSQAHEDLLGSRVWLSALPHERLLNEPERTSTRRFLILSNLVEIGGLEPPASSLRTTRSPS